MAVKEKKRQKSQIFEVEMAGGEGNALDMVEQGDDAVGVDPPVANGGGAKRKRKKSDLKKLEPLTEVEAPAAGGEGDAAAEEEEGNAPAAVENGENRKKSKKTKFEIEMLGGGVAEVSGIMSNTAFDTLPVSEPTKNALRDTGFTHMTEVCASAGGILVFDFICMVFCT